MAEFKLFDEASPVCSTADWYADRDRAPHLEEDLHQGRLALSGRWAIDAVLEYGLRSIVDLGCGDGGLLSTLGPAGVPSWGYDLQPSNLDAAINERGVDARYGDVVNGTIDWGQLAIATEVLEHLVDPHGFLRKIAGNAEALIASSPWTENDRDHYGYHLWAWDTDGYAKMIEQAGFQVRRHTTTGMFQVISATVAQ